jgi:uncharacterized membrane protein
MLSAATIRLRIGSASPWVVAVWVASGIYALLLSVQSVYEHHTLQTAFDVAVYDQRLWLLANGREPFSTIVSKPFLGDHFEPDLILLTPLYWLGLGVTGILIAQAIGMALTAPALFALGRESNASHAAASIPAFLWLASPAVAAANLYEFRPATFAPALLVLSVLAAKQNRPLLLTLTAALALGLKEDVALTYIVLGLLLVFHRKRRGGAILAAGSVASFLVASLIIQSLGDQYEWQGRRFAGDRGDSIFDAFSFMARHPLDTVGDAIANGGLDLLVLVLSTGGLALLAPSWMLLAAPTVAFNALSAYEFQHDLAHQYHLLAATGLFVAAGIGAGRLASLGEVARKVATAGVAAAVVIALTGGIATHDVSSSLSSAERVAIRRALDRIPGDAAVAAAPDLLPQVSQRVDVYTFPEPFVQIDWGSPLTPEDMAERAERVRFVALGRTQPPEYPGDIDEVKEMLLSNGWNIAARAGPVEILERR